VASFLKIPRFGAKEKDETDDRISRRQSPYPHCIFEQTACEEPVSGLNGVGQNLRSSQTKFFSNCVAQSAELFAEQISQRLSCGQVFFLIRPLSPFDSIKPASSNAFL
jgi:hypothetical protein